MDCGDGMPFCDETAHICYECQTHTDCLNSSRGKYCSGGACVQCIDSVNCESTLGKEISKEKCIYPLGCTTTCFNNKCQVENCTTNATCNTTTDCDKTKPLCVNATCAECVTAIDCGVPESNCLFSCTNSSCIKTCACTGANCSCSLNSECEIRDDATPICKKTPTSSMCVECYNNTHCNKTEDKGTNTKRISILTSI